MGLRCGSEMADGMTVLFTHVALHKRPNIFHRPGVPPCPVELLHRVISPQCRLPHAINTECRRQNGVGKPSRARTVAIGVGCSFRAAPRRSQLCSYSDGMNYCPSAAPRAVPQHTSSRLLRVLSHLTLVVSTIKSYLYKSSHPSPFQHPHPTRPPPGPH